MLLEGPRAGGESALACARWAPKEVLTDAAIRAEVVPGLSLRRICQLLQRFVSDDFAPDPLPPGALQALD